MCTGRVDIAFILRAFTNGNDGVFIGGCWPGECHYITEGNYLALSGMHLTKKLLAMVGVNPERLSLEWISASEGTRFAEVMNDFSAKLKGLGRLGEGENEDKDGLQAKLEVLTKLIPYIKLVERERLRVPLKSEEAYNDFFASDDFERLFQELIVDKFEIAKIMSILRGKPFSSGEISEVSGLSPSEVSMYLKNLTRQGFVNFDVSQKRFVSFQGERTGTN